MKGEEGSCWCEGVLADWVVVPKEVVELFAPKRVELVALKGFELFVELLLLPKRVAVVALKGVVEWLPEVFVPKSVELVALKTEDELLELVELLELKEVEGVDGVGV